jgi:hypothetical protein
MKQIYLLFIFTAFISYQMNAQEPCPDGGTTSLGGTQIIFSYAPATSFCVNRPTTIEVGTSTFSLDLGSCSETISVYNKTSGPAIVGQDFTVTSGFDSNCVYSSGTLPVDEYTFLNENVKFYPNPLTSDQTIKLSFGLPIKGNVSIFSITGKQVFHDVVNNENKKEINVANLTNGIYMLKVSTESASTTRKVVIMK